MKSTLSGLIILLFLISCSTSTKESKPSSSEIPLIIGTYTQKEGHVDGKGEGIYIYRFDTISGEMTYESVMKGITNPSFVAASSSKVVVAVSETDPGEVVSYVFDSLSYELHEVKRISSFGSYPCFIDFGVDEQDVFVVNYGSGTVAGYKVNAKGDLVNYWQNEHQGSGTTDRQQSPHPHMVINNPYNPQELYIPDLGMDAVVVYSESNGTFRNTAYIGLPRSSGPRHMVFHPKLDGHMYLVNELKATVIHFIYDQTINTYKMADSHMLTPNKTNSKDRGASAIDITPNGKYLYAAVRGDQNEVVGFKVNANGSLTQLEAVSSEGQTPREIKVDPSGRFLLVGNQDSGTVCIFEITEEGKLNKQALNEVPTPVSFAFIR